jgi:hypothetical protein
MKGIPREIVEHKLNIKPGSKPAKQRLRRFNDDEKCKAIGEEIKKLLSSGFIREVFHPEWLANPVLVKKKNKKWRMCVDYTGLNKACPKDPFPLPRIDQVVNLIAGFETLYFLYAYSGYHQMVMCIADQLILVHYSMWRLLLEDDAFQAQKRGCHIPKMHAMCLRGTHRTHHGGVRR